jgi:hypothetical protein
MKHLSPEQISKWWPGSVSPKMPFQCAECAREWNVYRYPEFFRGSLDVDDKLDHSEFRFTCTRLALLIGHRWRGYWRRRRSPRP